MGEGKGRDETGYHKQTRSSQVVLLRENRKLDHGLGAAFDRVGREWRNSPSLPQYSTSVSYPNSCSRKGASKLLGFCSKDTARASPSGSWGRWT